MDGPEREAIDCDGDAWTDRLGTWSCVTDTAAARDDEELQERFGIAAIYEGE